jgi:hypothetical protein
MNQVRVINKLLIGLWAFLGSLKGKLLPFIALITFYLAIAIVEISAAKLSASSPFSPDLEVTTEWR